jgi:hypothetical protein
MRATPSGQPSAGDAAPGQGTANPGDANGVADRTAAAYLPIEDLSASQTYRAQVEVMGWRNPASRVLEVRVTSAELLGPMDAQTGEPTGEPAEPSEDRSGYVEGQVLLVTATASAASNLPAEGPVGVRLVLVPSGDGAVFWIDKVVE